MLKESTYQKSYKEIELIGKGNFGSAILIQNLINNEKYVAKKIVLTNLQEKEQNQAL